MQQLHTSTLFCAKYRCAPHNREECLFKSVFVLHGERSPKSNQKLLNTEQKPKKNDQTMRKNVMNREQEDVAPKPMATLKTSSAIFMLVFLKQMAQLTKIETTLTLTK